MTALLACASLLLATAGGTEDLRARSLAVEVLALAARGDTPSLARAAALVPDPLRADPVFRAAAANRALAGLLAAASLRERSATSSGGDEGLRAARTRREEALEELRPLVRAHPEDLAVLRALAVYLGLGGRAEELVAVARRARADGGEDPWIDFAEVSAATRGTASGEAAGLLSGFVSSHAGILPARMSLARAQLAMGDRDRVLSTLDALLAVAPDHEDAQALKAELLAPPPVKMEVPPVPQGAPPPTPPGYLPRKGRRPAAAG